MENRAVYRCHYRGCLTTEDPAQLQPLMDACKANAQALIDDGAMMTVGLYYFGSQLFLYYEALGEQFRPETFMAPLHPLLKQWPEKEETCVFEDSHIAIQTANKIGVKTVGIYDKYNYGQEEMQKIADAYIAEGETLLKLLK